VSSAVCNDDFVTTTTCAFCLSTNGNVRSRFYLFWTETIKPGWNSQCSCGGRNPDQYPNPRRPIKS